MNILRPLAKEELEYFFSEHSLKVIQYFMNTSLFAQPEVYETKENLPIQIPKEHLEQWFVQALQVEAVGAGSYPIDILKPNEWGADVKMLSCKVDKNDNLGNGDSGETSLAQKFIGTGISLDEQFKQKQYQEIINGWTSIWKEKLINVKAQKNIEKIYYFFFLRGSSKESYICAFEVNSEDINTNTISQRDENAQIKQSIFLNGVIDSKYGNAKIYKAKKRLELRLKPKKLLDDEFLIAIPTQIPTKEDIYELVQDESKYYKYMLEKYNKFLQKPFTNRIISHPKVR
ncbi:MAG: Unknown protein [uncultured Sulfurovum sp.]|uniref:Uncharacterized protein n=1 Tax=uncultured Sulfurovum sp. TaxID=269237 RepID=A0A6S6TJE9_9BACT|nr:MAG: Unknown protein [uncultured Sulfurovum sp.]